MRPQFFRSAGLSLAAFGLMAWASIALAEPRHAIAMYGTPALPPDFVSMPYVNPDAPRGGKIVFGEPGGFDSLHPFIVKGNAPWGVGVHVFETLMGRSIDEPFTLYGLLAESIDVPPDRSWVEFTLRPEARFSDGAPVSVADVIWSYEVLGTKGHPKYHSAWEQVSAVEQTGPRSVRFTFASANRELALLMGMRPILQKAQWEGADFARSGFDVVPVGSGPYVIDAYEANRFIRFKRNPDYWGNDLPFMAGKANLDEIRYDFFGDGDVIFEAFKAGEITTLRETSPARWQRDYDFPAVRDGRIVKSEIPNALPSGIKGFVMNTRRPIFSDWRVREAMILAFNYEAISETIQGDVNPRITSFFSNSDLAMRPGPATGLTRDYLAPYASELIPGVLDGYAVPKADGPRNRTDLRRAAALLQDAGYTVANGGLVGPDGRAASFDILLRQGATQNQNIIDLYLPALARLGLRPTVTVVDSAQYVQRTDRFDFDMAYYERRFSLSPGTEQKLYWGRESRDVTGSRNWMGIDSPAVDAMIDAMLNAPDSTAFTAATRALDRLLTAGRYVIPIWYPDRAMLAHDARLRYPQTLPISGATVGFQPDVWWWEDEQK